MDVWAIIGWFLLACVLFVCCSGLVFELLAERERYFRTPEEENDIKEQQLRVAEAKLETALQIQAMDLAKHDKTPPPVCCCQ